MKIEDLVKKATGGDKTALEGIAAAIQDDVYYLSLRMLVNPEDARDATQEILIKIITNLSSFKFESQFKTWVYRVSTNYLISEKKVLAKYPDLTFDLYKQDLESDLQKPDNLQNDPAYQTLLNELRISCTMAMLLCLNPLHRMAYILGDILELNHSEASEVLSISKDNFRQQLSRARNRVIDFMSESCGLVSNCANCSCERKLTGAIKRNRVNSNTLVFSSNAQYSYFDLKESLSKTQNDLKALTVQKAINHYKSPAELSEVIEELVSQGLKN